MALDEVSAPDEELPEIDDQIVVPETRYEMWDGELVYVSPAEEPHGRMHAQLAALVAAYAAGGFAVACEMLMRTSVDNDFAPDVSLYPEARHPRTGRRQIDEISFEVINTQRRAHAGEKAAKLTRRGVRRVIAIDVVRARVLEWSTKRGAWQVLDPDGAIVDPALAIPLPVATLLTSIGTDDAMARALLSKNNAVLVQDRERERAEGKAEGKAEALIAMLAARGFAIDRAVRRRIARERDVARIDQWIARAATCRSVGELLRGPRRTARRGQKSVRPTSK